MKDFIKKILKQKLDEVKLSRHALERAEERVWGTKGEMTNGQYNNYPPTINADAWANQEEYNKMNAPTVGDGEKEIPVTNPVREILQKINFVKNTLVLNTDIELNEKKNENITLLIYFSPNKLNYGGNIWGDSLTAICKPDGDGGTALTIEWQNKVKDLASLKGGSQGIPKYVISVDYLIKKGITEINKDNIEEISLYYKKDKSTDDTPKKETYKKIKLTDDRVVRYYEGTKKFETLEGEPIDTFDIIEFLPKELQDAVLNSID